MSIPTFVVKNLRTLERVATTNSPAILTAAGVAGVVATSIFTHKATVKTVRALDNDRYVKSINKVTVGDPEPRTKKETIALTWKFWLAPAAVGTLTICSVIGAQYINTKRMAALAAGYIALESKHEEYREKVEELLGKKKADEVDQAVGKEVINRSVVQEVEILTGDVPCIDALSNKVFSSNYESIRKAVNDINERIVHGDQPSVSDLYSCIGGGLKPTRLSDAFGWNDENMCEPKITTILDDAGVPCLYMDFSVLPVGNFWKVNEPKG